MITSNNSAYLAGSRIDIRIPILHVLNLLDAVLTLHFLSLGATELNPIMAYAHSVSPHLFFIGKIAVVSVCLCFLDKNLRAHRDLVLAILLLVYGLLVLWHAYGMTLVWGGEHHSMMPPAP